MGRTSDLMGCTVQATTCGNVSSSFKLSISSAAAAAMPESPVDGERPPVLIVQAPDAALFKALSNVLDVESAASGASYGPKKDALQVSMRGSTCDIIPMMYASSHQYAVLRLDRGDASYFGSGDRTSLVQIASAMQGVTPGGVKIAESLAHPWSFFNLEPANDATASCTDGHTAPKTAIEAILNPE